MTREQIRQAADILREIVSTRDYAARIGLQVNRSGFVQCFMHQGDKNGSLKVYNEPRRGFHCFGCGASGDVIELAKRFYNIGFVEAIAKVAEDMGIALPGVRPTYTQAQAIKAAEKRKEELERQQREEQAVEDEYFATLDDYIEIENYLAEVADREWETLKADAAAVTFSDAEIAEAERKRKEREQRIHDRIIHGGKPSADNLPPFDEDEYRRRQAEKRNNEPVPESELSKALNARNNVRDALERMEIRRMGA